MPAASYVSNEAVGAAAAKPRTWCVRGARVDPRARREREDLEIIVDVGGRRNGQQSGSLCFRDPSSACGRPS